MNSDPSRLDEICCGWPPKLGAPSHPVGMTVKFSQSFLAMTLQRGDTLIFENVSTPTCWASFTFRELEGTVVVLWKVPLRIGGKMLLHVCAGPAKAGQARVVTVDCANGLGRSEGDNCPHSVQKVVIIFSRCLPRLPPPLGRLNAFVSLSIPHHYPPSLVRLPSHVSIPRTPRCTPRLILPSQTR